MTNTALDTSRDTPADTQWPRWEVFKQDNPKKVHQAVGSVHAVDSEHALLTAKSVFVRRPSAVSLWVVQADDIYSVTQEELASLTIESNNDSAEKNFFVFNKTSNRRSMTFVNHVGEVKAVDVQSALTKAIEAFSAEEEVLTWWIIAENSLTKSEVSDDVVESWFAPAKEKTYRQQSEYGLVGKHPSERTTSRRQKTKEKNKEAQNS